MNDDALTAIRNFRRLDACIATAGQPTEEQLRAVAAAGFRSVINLALPTSTYALADERASVAALAEMREVWEPDEVWARFPAEQLSEASAKTTTSA